MKIWQVLLIYNLLLPLALLVGLPRYLIKAIQRGGARKNFAQRFGRYDREVLDLWQQEASGPKTWIHAVSVGEVLVGLKVIQASLDAEPDRKLVLSTTTPTGFRLAKDECPDSVSVIYNPIDLPWVVKGALDRIQPDHLVLVEAEVWPNLVYQAKKKGVRVSLVNARLSGRSERRFKQFGTLTRPIFRMLDCVCVQFERDVPRWQGLGVELERIHESGSIKYDEEDQEKPLEQIEEMEGLLRKLKISPQQPVLLAGSTHAGEEALIGKVYQEICETIPDLIYIAVPRHVERSGEVIRDLEEIGLKPVLRTECAEMTDEESSESGPDKPQSLVVNTTGELRAWYYLASVVVMGKSFLGNGGQNPVEPLMAGKPVVTGPHMENFKAVMSQLLESRGLVQVSRDSELRGALTDILKDSEVAEAMVNRGREALQRHRGAATRTIKKVYG